MKANPFTLMFGKEPKLSIKRDDMASEIINDFTSDLPSTQLYTIIGARGSGKTVFLTEIYDYFDSRKTGWWPR